MSELSQGVLKVSTQLASAVASTAHEATKLILDLLKDFADLVKYEQFKDYTVEGGNLECFDCEDFMYAKLDDKLTKKGIPHAIMEDTTTGRIVCVIRDIDKDLVNDVKNEILAEEKRVSRISTQELYRLNVKKNIASFSDLSETQVKMFQEEAKKNNFVMAAQQQENGSYKVFFAAKDTEKAKQSLFDVTLNSTGIRGQLNEKSKNTSIENIKKINEQLKDPSKEFYIVSSANINEFINVNKNDFKHMKNGNLVRIDQRDSTNFVNNIHYQSMGVVNPIVFSKAEFEQFKENVEKVAQIHNIDEFQTSAKMMKLIHTQYNGNVKDFLEAEKRGDISYSTKEINNVTRLVIKDKNYSPELSKEQFRQMQLEDKMRQLISAKMSLDNGNQNKIFSSLYNSEVSFSEFFAYEVANDQYDVDKNNEINNIAKELDSLPDKDKDYLRDFVKNIDNDLNEHHYGSEYVDPAKLSRENLDDFINAHDGFGDNTRDEYQRDDNEFDK